MAQPIQVTSTSHFSELLSSNTYVVVDFHATWCGPCHMIAPTYSKLSAAQSKQGQIAFAKVDVDEQQAIAAQQGISAMPTFLLFKNGQVVDSVRGANLPALTKLVAKAAAEVERLDAVAEVDDAASTQESVSGGYTLSKGAGWKTSL